LIALFYAVAGETSASLYRVLALLRIARLLLRSLPFDGALPYEGRDGFDAVFGQTELRHLGFGPEFVSMLKPERYPLFLQFGFGLFQVRADLLLIPHQVFRLNLKLIDLGVYLRIGDAQIVGSRIELLRLLVRGRRVCGFRHAIDFAQVVPALHLQVLNRLICVEEPFALAVVSFITMATDAALQLIKLFAAIESVGHSDIAIS